jgi:hypothetical protein
MFYYLSWTSRRLVYNTKLLSSSSQIISFITHTYTYICGYTFQPYHGHLHAVQIHRKQT